MAPHQQYHVYALPPELLDTLVPRDVVNQPPPSPPRSELPLPAAEPAATSARACNICLGASFADVDQQRAHFRSDWHRYNVKIRLNGSDPVTENQFAKLVDELDDSISGSASSTDDESADDSDAVRALVDKTHCLRARSPSPSSAPRGPQTPIVWFHSPPSTQLGVYKAVLSPSLPSSSAYLDELKDIQVPREGGRTWALFMTAGGHFAGAIVRVSKPAAGDESEVTKKGKQKKPVPDIEVLKHKTFHRYTTRKKQGGSQSLNDNAKSKAVSAGAMLRRYGEQALRDDIRNLLQEWAEDIQDCERIWIRASVSNRRIFLDYDGALIAKGDDRLRTFPFPTRRPTQSELSRCLLELTRVKISHLTEEALREQDEAYLASLPKPKPAAPLPPEAPTKPKETVPRLSPEEQQLRDKWSRLLEIIHKGRLDPLKGFWAKEGENLGGVDTPVPAWTGEKGATLLQIAAHAGQEEVTRWLLEDLHANPAIDVPTDTVVDAREFDEEDPMVPSSSGSRRTAYDLARTREVRNVFRRCAAAHPDWWDWLGTEKGGARVPSVLTKEMEEGREEKKKVRRKGLKDRIKERQEKETSRAPSPTPEPEPPQPQRIQKEEPNTGPRRLGGNSGASEGVLGLTPEMRAKIERERRARAAEARLRTLGGRR